MRKTLLNAMKVTALAGIAVSVGVGVAVATTVPAGGGNAEVTGVLRVGLDSAKNVTVTTDIFGIAGLDNLNFGTGIDSIAFGSEDASISYETTWGGSANDDAIAYTAGAGATDDTVQVRSDIVEIFANNGDVIIQLGS